MKQIKLTKNNYKAIIDVVSKIVSNGGLAVVPFDTVYGFICDPRNENALRKLFLVKKRPIEKTIGIAVSDTNELMKIAEVDDSTIKFIETRVPGRYTFILQLRDESISKLCIKEGSVGIRIPDSDLVQNIAKECGGVLAQTSANKSGLGNTFSIPEFISQYSNEELSNIDLIIDDGQIRSNSASQIFDLICGVPRTIERN